MILARDILILVGGLLIAAKTKYVLPSDKFGKATVVLIGIVLLMMLINVDRNAVYYLLVYYLSIGLIVVSFANYVYKAVTAMNKK